MVMEFGDRLASGFKLIAAYFEKLSDFPEPSSIYRGHADHSWALAPSAARKGAAGIDARAKLRSWQRMASRLASPRPTSDLEWLALAQHYGIATTLLDWTINPLIALYFAAGDPNEATGCVWQVSRSAFKSLDLPSTIDVFMQDRDVPGLVDATSMNARSAAQDSVMSVHPPGASFQPADDGGRIVFLIEPDDKGAVQLALAELGLNEARLFADFGVVVRNFQSQLRLMRLIDAGKEAERIVDEQIATALKGIID